VLERRHIRLVLDLAGGILGDRPPPRHPPQQAAPEAPQGTRAGNGRFVERINRLNPIVKSIAPPYNAHYTYCLLGVIPTPLKTHPRTSPRRGQADGNPRSGCYPFDGENRRSSC